MRPTVEMIRRGHKLHVKGGGPGPKSPAERRAMLYPQAENVIRKFGGARELARVLKQCADPKFQYNPSSIYRWMYPREVGGTGGEIPTKAIKAVVKAARYAGIMLTIDDLYPRVFD